MAVRGDAVRGRPWAGTGETGAARQWIHAKGDLVDR